MSINYTAILSALCTLTTLPSFAQEQPIFSPLTPAEADAIVSQQMTEKEQQRQARIAELESIPVIESFEADLGDRKVIFNRVQPATKASLAKTAVSAAKQTQPALTEAELIALREQYAAQTYETLFLSGTVFENGVTELNWVYEGVNYQAFANVNFEYLTGIGEFSTANASYSVMMSVGRDSQEMLARLHQEGEIPAATASTTRWHPNLTNFSGKGVEYLVMSDDDTILGNDAAFAGIEAMLLYYQEHETELKIAYQRRIALQEAKQRYLEANPPQPQDTIINFSPSPDSKSLQNR